MTKQERIEEAHGLWELAAIKVLTIVEVELSSRHVTSETRQRTMDALHKEKEAFEHWKEVSRKALS